MISRVPTFFGKEKTEINNNEGNFLFINIS
jgi:hypothetical protein